MAHRYVTTISDQLEVQLCLDVLQLSSNIGGVEAHMTVHVVYMGYYYTVDYYSG